MDILATALYVTTDDLLKDRPDLAPRRPTVGIAPRFTDAELITLAMMQAMLGFTSEARWLRHARAHLRHLFPYLPQQPGCNKRLRKAAELLRRVTRYGYCASHSRFFWGLRLHLVCTLQGLPVAFALTGAEADERETLLDLLAAEPYLVAARPGQTLIGDKNYFGRDFERELAQQGIRLLRPTRAGEGQLNLERHRGRTPGGVIVRVMQRVLGLTAAIWHNDRTGQAILRSLTSYDH
nr:transposase [Streptomyces sp. SID4946]